VRCPLALVALGSSRTSVAVPVKLAPASLETLSTMSLLQAPSVLTPSYRAWPKREKFCGTQPLSSLECVSQM
jgi:hypothetical protein